MRAQYDSGSNVRTESGMRDGENSGFDHIRVAQQHLFDLGGRNLLPSAIDDLVDPADDEEISFHVQVTNVAGSKPSVPKGGLGSGGIVVVPPRYGGTPQRDLSMFTGRKPPIFAVQDRNFGPRGLTDGSELSSAQRIC